MRYYLIHAACDNGKGGLDFNHFIAERDRFPSATDVHQLCIEKYAQLFVGVTGIIEMNMGEIKAWGYQD